MGSEMERINDDTLTGVMKTLVTPAPQGFMSFVMTKVRAVAPIKRGVGVGRFWLIPASGFVAVAVAATFAIVSSGVFVATKTVETDLVATNTAVSEAYAPEAESARSTTLDDSDKMNGTPGELPLSGAPSDSTLRASTRDVPIGGSDLSFVSNGGSNSSFKSSNVINPQGSMSLVSGIMSQTHLTEITDFMRKYDSVFVRRDRYNNFRFDITLPRDEVDAFVDGVAPMLTTLSYGDPGTVEIVINAR